jgi:carbon storage regulator CsrA
MLILSRRASETIRFPQLGISVSIVSVKGNRVQVGIDAPPEIQIIRRELESSSVEATDHRGSMLKTSGTTQTSQSDSNKAQHDLRNRLNKATLGLLLAQKQLAAGQIESADKTLVSALARLSELESLATLAPAPKPNQVGLKAFVAERRHSQDDGSVGSWNKSPTCIDVLLVEDDLNEQALLQGLLEMEGYRVHTACNGHEAIDCLSRITPKFVLLDMMMPECDGRETFDRIRELPAFENLPIFAVSGSSPDSVGLSIGGDGVDDWFPKPLNAPRLVQHMRSRVAVHCS